MCKEPVILLYFLYCC